MIKLWRRVEVEVVADADEGEATPATPFIVSIRTWTTPSDGRGRRHTETTTDRKTLKPLTPEELKLLIKAGLDALISKDYGSARGPDRCVEQESPNELDATEEPE